MSKKLIALCAAVGLVMSGGFVWAVPTFPSAQLTTPSGIEKTLFLPKIAFSRVVENSPVISYLGSGVDPESGKVVEGYAIIHYKKGFGKPDGKPGGKPDKGKGGGGEKCYSFLAKGTKWRTSEDYVVDPSNTRGLDEAQVRVILAGGIAKWEDAADGAVDGSLMDILGNENLSKTVNRSTIGDLNGENEIIFADIGSEGAIAVTIVWGIFGGPPFARELVEWDQVYDDVDFDWSSTGEAGKMDFENIVTHELGHSVGMGHPDNSCTEETMYRFADYGEIKKQTLEAGDISGISKLY